MVKFVFYKNFSACTMENEVKRDKVDVRAYLQEHCRSLSGEVMMVMEVRDH